jgi:hypothetical protein
MDFSFDGKRIITGDHSLLLVNVESGKKEAEYLVNSKFIYTIAAVNQITRIQYQINALLEILMELLK